MPQDPPRGPHFIWRSLNLWTPFQLQCIMDQLMPTHATCICEDHFTCILHLQLCIHIIYISYTHNFKKTFSDFSLTLCVYDKDHECTVVEEYK